MSLIPDHDPAISAQTKQPATLALTIGFPALSAIAVSLRLYTRLVIVKRTGPDDWFILGAFVWHDGLFCVLLAMTSGLTYLLTVPSSVFVRRNCPRYLDSTCWSR